MRGAVAASMTKGGQDRGGYEDLVGCQVRGAVLVSMTKGGQCWLA